MGDLPDGQGPVAMVGIVVGNHLPMKVGLVLLHRLARGLLVDTRDVRVVTRQQGRPGGAANGPLAMGVQKEGSLLGQAVDVRGEGLRMAVHAADPVIKIINGNEQDVGLACRKAKQGHKIKERGEAK